MLLQSHMDSENGMYIEMDLLEQPSVSSQSNDQNARPLLNLSSYFKDSTIREVLYSTLYQYSTQFGNYNGQSKHSKRWGRGIQISNNGEILEGHFVNDIPVGRLHHTQQAVKQDVHYINGIKYTYKTIGQKTGIGIRFISDQIYIGGFMQGVYYGNGSLQCQSFKYIGQFKEFIHGNGIVRIPNGQIQTGEFFQGYFQGYGAYKFADGTIDVGQWILAKPWGEYCRITREETIRGHYRDTKKEGYFITDGPNGILEEYYINDQNHHADQIFYARNNTLYKGQFKNGLLEGEGAQISYHMNIQGTFVQGVPYGKITYSDTRSGIRYQGQIQSGMKHGHGRLEGLDYSYIGYFFQNRYHGQGTYKSDEYEYEGNQQMGNKNGKGKITYLDAGPSTGAKYDGYWVNDERHGEGEFRYLSGAIQRGAWRNNYMYGYGIQEEVANHWKYKGYFKDSQPCGLGRIINSNWILFACFQVVVTLQRQVMYSLKLRKGQFSNASIREGNYTKQLGQVKKTILHGQGTRICNNELSIGNYVNGKAQGYCQVLNTYTLKGSFVNGQPSSGLIKNKCYILGSLKNGALHGQGTMITLDGILQIGEFVEGLLDGQGHNYQKDQVIYQGTFKQDKMWGNIKRILFNTTLTMENYIIQQGFIVYFLGEYQNMFIKEGTLCSDRRIYQGKIIEFKEEQRKKEYFLQ